MKSFKSKKAKIVVSVIAVMLVVCLLTVSLAGCNASPVGVTPTTVFFVGNFQKDANPSEYGDILKEGETLTTVQDMLDTTGWTLENDPYDVIAGIYALAVTNYSKVARSGMMIMTDSSIQARNVSGLLGGATANVGVRSTYSFFQDQTGSYTQTISGVTVLKGLSSVVERLRGNFGWNTVVYNNATTHLYAEKQGFSAGAEFYGEGNNASNVLKYIMGANNPKLSKVSHRNINLEVKEPSDDVAEEYVSDRVNAWDPLDRLPYDKDEGGEIEVAGTYYYRGTYGASWALSDFSNKDYFDESKTTVIYDPDLKLYTIDITLLSEYAAEASDFTMGDLVKETKSYIELANAVYTESRAKIEVYESGLIKSIQKMDTLNSDDPCKLVVISGTCQDGGSASNRITYAFSYDKDDCDPLTYVALYWPELGKTELFSKKKVDTKYMLDLSGYTAFSKYNPKANDLASKFESIYSFDWSKYDGSTTDAE